MLYGLSRTVRYMADPSRWVPLADIETQVLGHLYKVEKSVQKLMGKDLGLKKVVLLSSRIDGAPPIRAESPATMKPGAVPSVDAPN